MKGKYLGRKEEDSGKRRENRGVDTATEGKEREKKIRRTTSLEDN